MSGYFLLCHIFVYFRSIRQVSTNIQGRRYVSDLVVRPAIEYGTQNYKKENHNSVKKLKKNPKPVLVSAGLQRTNFVGAYSSQLESGLRRQLKDVAVSRSHRAQTRPQLIVIPPFYYRRTETTTTTTTI